MAQNTNEYGKIVSVAEAANLFGQFVTSYQLLAIDLLDYCQNAGRVIMFAEENGELYIAGTGRTTLSTNTQPPSPDLIFHVFSVTKVNELIALGNEQFTIVEIRTDVVDLKNGEYVLEYGWPCPPYCS